MTIHKWGSLFTVFIRNIHKCCSLFFPTFLPRCLFINWLPFSLGMSQSESAVKFESASSSTSRSALKFVGRSISEIVFKCSSLKMLKSNSDEFHLNAKVFCLRRSVFLVYIFYFWFKENGRTK